MRVIELKEINSSFFNISSTFSFLKEENALPPIALSIEDTYFQISGFSSLNNSFLDYGQYSKTEAINLYASLNQQSFFYDLHIINIAYKLNANVREIAALSHIKDADIYYSALNLDRIILEYIALKNLSPKLIKLINSFNENEKRYISSYLSKNEPSLQNFKKFIENIADFDLLPEDFNFPNRISSRHLALNEAFEKLQKECKISLKHDESFESSKILISFDNFESFKLIKNSLEEKEEAFKEYFKVLKENGIC